MKKITALILALCTALTLTLPAFADAGGPAFSSFDVTLTADTQYYRIDWNDDSVHLQGTLPAGTVVTVQYEYENNGVDYASVSLPSNDDRWYYIRLSDIHLDNEVYGPEEGNLLSEPVYVLVIAEDGVALHAGPNEKYDVLTTIPQNIRLGYIVDNGTNGDATWAYVTYHDYKGWINIDLYDYESGTGLAQCCEDGEPIRLWALADTNLYGSPSRGNMLNELPDEQKEDMDTDVQQPADPIVGTFARGAKCDCLYYQPATLGTWYFVSVGDQSGWAFSVRELGNIARQDDRADERHHIFVLPFAVDLYDEPDLSAQCTSVSVKANTEFEKKYVVNQGFEEFAYVTLAGKRGWASSDELSGKTAYRLEPDDPWTEFEEARHVGASGGTPIYADLTDSSTQIGTIPADAHVSMLYDGYVTSDYADGGSVYRVRSGNVTGWVWEEEMRILEDMEYEGSQAPDSSNGYDGTWRYEAWNDAAKAAESDPKYAADIRPDAKAEKKSGIDISPMLLILICVAVAALLTITVCVTLMLIRRKRKNKQ